MRKLTEANKATFFILVEKGEVFTFSEAVDLQTVFRLAHELGWFIAYEPPGTKNYRDHGCLTCKVLFPTRQRTMWNRALNDVVIDLTESVKDTVNHVVENRGYRRSG